MFTLSPYRIVCSTNILNIPSCFIAHHINALIARWSAITCIFNYASKDSGSCATPAVISAPVATVVAVADAPADIIPPPTAANAVAAAPQVATVIATAATATAAIATTAKILLSLGQLPR